MVPLPKKTDIVMAVAPESKALVDVKMRCSAPHAWSHMADCYTSTIPLFCGLEVKRHGGSSEEAELQLGVWQAAALAHLTARLAIEAYPAVSPSSLVPPVIPPTIGCTVVGHQWSFYIAWTEPANGNQGAVVCALRLPSHCRLSNHLPDHSRSTFSEHWHLDYHNHLHPRQLVAKAYHLVQD